MFRKDRNKFRGGIMLYLNENVPCKILNAGDYLKCFAVILREFSLRNRKLLCFGLYKPTEQNDKIFLDATASTLTTLSCKYGRNIMLIIDVNLTVGIEYLDTFIITFRMESL